MISLRGGAAGFGSAVPHPHSHMLSETMAGSFRVAGRMGASIGLSAGMRELVTDARRDYEDLSTTVANSHPTSARTNACPLPSSSSLCHYHALRQRLCFRRPFQPLARPREWMGVYERGLQAVHEVAHDDVGRGSAGPGGGCVAQPARTHHVVVGA